MDASSDLMHRLTTSQYWEQAFLDTLNALPEAILICRTSDLFLLWVNTTYTHSFQDIPLEAISENPEWKNWLHDRTGRAYHLLFQNRWWAWTKRFHPLPSFVLIVGCDITDYKHQELLFHRERDQYQTLLATSHDMCASYGRLIGISPAMQSVYRHLDAAAQPNITFPVLLQGETGTGKSLAAHTLHDRLQAINPSRTGPLVTVNCPAIPHDLFEAELFGHSKGAFTGAMYATGGYCQAAHQGTLFFDEIGDLPLSLQVKLLHLIQEREITPIGGTHPVSVTARIVAASNKDLWIGVKRGWFREDLFYRLDGMAIRLPALRDRRVDIPCYLNHLAPQYGLENWHTFPHALLDAIDHELQWEGNVRQLYTLVERMMTTCLEIADSQYHKAPTERFSVQPLAQSLATHEKTQILKALQATTTLTDAAKLLGISRRHLYRKLETYQILH